MEIASKLKEFELTDIVDERVELGRGSYASVVKLQFRGLKCAGKRFHSALSLDCDDVVQREASRQRWCKECVILGSLRHPNIVQFLGIYFEKHALPVLVMEFVPFTLSHQLKRHGIFPQEISCGILVDVAKALCYLHGGNPLIIHRDLTANNVLLTFDMRAKISDLGTAKILDITPAQKLTMTKCPGTLCYMPPEALARNPVYRTEIDSFSYGVLLLHIFYGDWPLPDQPIGDDGKPIACTEVERRECYLNKMGHDHPLVELTKKCLSDIPSNRPSATEILDCVQKVAEQHPLKFDSALTMIGEVNSLTEELKEAKSVLSREQKDYRVQLAEIEKQTSEGVREERRQSSIEKDQLVQVWTEERKHYKSKNESLLRRLEAASLQQSTEISILTSQISQLTSENSHITTELRKEKAKHDQQMNSLEIVIEMKNNEYKRKHSEIKEKNEELEVKTKEISTLQAMNKAVSTDLESKTKELEFKKEAEMAVEKQIKAMQLQLRAQRKRVNAMTEQLEMKESQINALQCQVKQMTKQVELVQKELELQCKHSATNKSSLLERLSQQNRLLEENKQQMKFMRNNEIAPLKANLKEKEGIIADLVQQMQNVQKFLSEKVSIYIQILAHLQCFYPTFSKTGNRTKMLLF